MLSKPRKGNAERGAGLEGRSNEELIPARDERFSCEHHDKACDAARVPQGIRDATSTSKGVPMSSHRLREKSVFAARASKGVRVSARVSMRLGLYRSRKGSVKHGGQGRLEQDRSRKGSEELELRDGFVRRSFSKGKAAFSVWTSKVVRIGFEGRTTSK